MSTTFIVRVPSIKTFEDNEEIEVEVAYRSNGMRWLNPLGQLLPDNLKVIATDNTHQGIYTIGDIKNIILKKEIGYNNSMKDKTLLSKVYKELGIEFTFPIEISDQNGNQTYYENSDGYWYRREYDENGKQTYIENSDGYWYRREYDENGNETYFETSDGFWYRSEYDKNGNKTYLEDFDGFWYRSEYDKNGNKTYYENSDGDKEGTKN